MAGLASSLRLGDLLPPGKIGVKWVRTGCDGQLWALLGLSTLLLSFFGSADSCTQGCQVCALVFLHRLEALSVFSLSLFLTSRHAECPFLTLSGGGDLQESC